MKKIISLLLTVALLVTMTTAITTTVFAADGDITYLYCDANGENWQTGTKATGEYTLVTASDTAWGESGSETWYVASGEITIGSRVTVNGTVNLILADGCTLTVNGGIKVHSGNSLTIYGQSNQTGKLIADASTHYLAAGIGTDGAINGGTYQVMGTITINGGDITASGWGYATNMSGAGIGGGNRNAAGGKVVINNGTVSATNPGGGGSGIGPGTFGDPITVEINGGVICATAFKISGYVGPGIGGNVTITGGVITATSISGAAISGGIVSTDNGTTYTIYSDDLTDDFTNGGTITISNGETLTVPSGVTLTNNGTIVIEEGGQLIIEGTLINNGTITNNGSINNNGTIANNGTGTCGANNHVMGTDHKCLICGCYGTTITYSVAPTYTVTIPATVTLGGTATIKAENVVIEKGTQVEVSLAGTSESDNTFKLKTQEGAELTYTVKNNGNDVAVGDTVLTVNPDTDASGETTLSFIPPTGDIQFAGEYTGTVTFTVSVEAAS